ncbi:methionine--tRNA ligase [Candidatus Deianiraea vastatrix]|uniref:methionine--tRNA ligase n=1 Tax=Candidatus Deianiraea vastatrix TaxID=2163644 RepID=A0A5B8XF65_9RICK|nr:methionine--tRNA ligase [Candidatus Deianiraea vastatrix]QED23932.1 Methionine--tRNA ligase [Candidatus Deianiraea vastatrix]
MKTYYITTPIYYVNDKPHIGHWYTTIATDILYRNFMLSGFDARMQTGTDEHGQKIQKSAEKKGINEMQFCNEVSGEFYKMTVLANCACSYKNADIANFNEFENAKNALSNNKEDLFSQGENFIRTSEGRDKNTGEITEQSLKEGRHVKFVIDFWNKLLENGFIYKGKYEGWYAVRDEAFYGESEIVNGKAPSGAEVEWRVEECYFFKLSAFQKILIALLNAKKDMVMPHEKYTEVLAFISGMRFTDAQKGEFKPDVLIDLCVSRPGLKWGIPVPNEENQSIYVWLDALTNYISALGEKADKYWLNRNNESVVSHIVGKDILRFHCVYWPAFLLASVMKIDEINSINNLEISDIYNKIKPYLKILPDKIYAHGWWTNNGEKISKSLGNVINPEDEISYIESLGAQNTLAVDYFRYFLLRAMPFGNDGDYSRSKLVLTVNADLVNTIGNLTQRTVSMAHKYLNSEAVIKISENAREAIKKSVDNYSKYDILNAIEEALMLARLANETIDKTAPWKLAKDGKIEEISQILSSLLGDILSIASLLQPICPFASSKILQIFNQKHAKYGDILNLDGVKINLLQSDEILFPRLVFEENIKK